MAAKKSKTKKIAPTQLQGVATGADAGKSHRARMADTDNSGRAAAKEALRQSEERFRLIAETSPDLIFQIDAQGMVTYCSPSVNQFGYRPDDVIGTHYSRYVSVENGAAAHQAFDRAMEGERTSDLELRVLRADGSARLVEISIAPLTMQGAVAGLQGISRDVTNRRRAEKALRESEELFRTLTERSPDCIALHDRELRHQYVNPAITRLTGLPQEVFIGKTVREIGLPPETAARLDSLLRRTLDARRETSGELAIPGADGPRFFQWQSVPLLAPDGSVRAILAIAGDITRHKKMEHALKENATMLAFVNKELEDFSTAVSHDLRAPLRAIEGFTNAILEDYGTTFDDTAKDYFNRVLSASRRMSQLIDAMLNMARLTKSELEEKTVDLSGLAGVIAHELQKKTPDRRVEFSIAPGVKAKGDTAMLRTVLENLMDNAWKFTGRQAAARIEFGTIDCGMRITDCEMKSEENEKAAIDVKSEIRNPKSEIVYFVRDNGAGFDMRYAEKLFMPFQRLHGDAEFPGLGIGLPIAHRIVLRHGGRIWAEAAPEKGATFFFTL